MAGKSKKFSQATKAAAVIVSMGTEYASEIYKHLRDDEIEQISLEVAKLEKMSPDDMQEIIDDFYGMCVTHKVISEGGEFYARDVLEKAFGSQRANAYMDRISQSIKVRAFEFVRKAGHKNLMMMLQNEHPQTIAFVLSYAKAEQSSKILADLPKLTQLDVIQRIASLDSVSPEIVTIVEKVLEDRFATVITEDMTEIGGINYVADIMKHTDRPTEKYIFEELGRSNPALSDEIRKLMFVFEDIVNLDAVSIQRILRDVDTQNLAVAIKGSSEEVKDMLLNNVSTRARERIMEDIQYLRNVRMKDVEEAQQKIVNAIRTLEETGEIVISRGGEEDIIIA